MRFRAKIFHIGSGCIEGIFHKLCKRCSNVMMLINLYIFLCFDQTFGESGTFWAKTIGESGIFVYLTFPDFLFK